MIYAIVFCIVACIVFTTWGFAQEYPDRVEFEFGHYWQSDDSTSIIDKIGITGSAMVAMGSAIGSIVRGFAGYKDKDKKL